VAQSLHADIIWGAKTSSFNYTQDAFDMPRFYQHVLKKKPDVRILIYSGLNDIFTVPFSYTMPCVNELIRRTHAKVTVPWKLWHSNPMHHLGTLIDLFYCLFYVSFYVSLYFWFYLVFWFACLAFVLILSHASGHWQQWSNNVTYATVRGAGHEVPSFQPYSV
jgi:hypothetical protein